MIFVTVGTHEQQFNRLIEAIDELKETGMIDDVMMQIGYSTYVPKYCNYEKFLSYQQMNEYIKQADVIITHGGPSTFMNVLLHGKSPIVVPRQKQYDEHVNDHQKEFLNKIKDKLDIVVVEDIEKLHKCIELKVDRSQKRETQQVKTNNKSFNNQLESIVINLFNN